MILFCGLLPLKPGGYSRIVDGNRGRVLLVNFWATWCEPCRDDLPATQRIVRRWRRQARLVTVSVDEPGEEQSAETLLKQSRVRGKKYLLAEPRTIEEVDAAWSGVLPALFVYDKTGRLRAKFLGETDRAGLSGMVQQLAEEK